MDNNIQEIFQVAHTHHQNNQLPEAETGYLEVLQLHADHVESQLNLANIYLLTNRPNEALNLLKPLSEQLPEIALVWSNLGVAQKFLMNYEQSLIAYEKATTLNPDSPEIKHDLSMVLQLLNRNDEAIQVLQSLTATHPQYLPARFFHVQLLNSLFHFDHAEKELLAILDDVPRQLDALVELGKLYNRTGALQQATTYFKQAIDQNPNHVDAQMGYGNLLCHLGDFQGGAQHLLHATQLTPQDWTVHFHLGNALLKGARFEDALAPLKRALELSPGNESVREALGWIYKRFVPQWHMSMVADSVRNQAYEQALDKVVNPESIVFDIGAGSGLLSMMAARQGARRVYTCEMSKVMSNMAEEIITKNGYEDQITLYPLKSTSLTPDQFEGKPNVLVSEILDAGLIGEHAIPTLRHALTELCDEACTIIPARAKIIGKLVSIPAMRAVNPVQEIEGFDFTPFDQFRVPKEYLVDDLTKYEHQSLTQSTDLMAYDFYDMGDPIPEHQWREKYFDMDIEESGLLDACVFWFKLWLDDEITITTDPDAVVKHHCWNQALYFFENKIEVKRGQKVRMKMIYNDIKIRFEVMAY
ncbi:MAG: tetratricopeptide repeat protein [Cytophagales bacterium]|nr:tetratricopeptide repeat protein [Cytophagales bacterium]